MAVATLFFLTSGLFLGWSLGANDTANIFGTAVGTRMIRFSTAAALASVFILVGAVVGGSGPAATLSRLGAVDALAGAFVAALAAGVAVFLMTRSGLPVSSSQAIVGAIVGWNLFTGNETDVGLLAGILSTWVICPGIATLFAAGMFLLARLVLRRASIHLLRLDAYTRLGLIVTGIFGAYSLGANNIANVVGVFLPASPFTDFTVAGRWVVTSAQQLYFVGGLAIAVGVVTYSERVMSTLGENLLPLTPIGAWVAVLAHSLVLFLFSSQGVAALLHGLGLPALLLVPVSSSQAVVGAVVGIGLVRGMAAIRWRVLLRIVVGWVTTPVVAGLLCWMGLFFMQNVFDQVVAR